MKEAVTRVIRGVNKAVDKTADFIEDKTPIDEMVGVGVRGISKVASPVVRGVAGAIKDLPGRRRRRDDDDDDIPEVVGKRDGGVVRKRVVRKRKGGPVGVGCAKRGYGKALPKRRVRT